MKPSVRLCKCGGVILRGTIFTLLIFFSLGNFALAEDSGFSDNVIGYRFGTIFKEPAVASGGDIAKQILNFKHYNTDSLGSNFLNIDALFSYDNDPAKNSSEGAEEYYLIYRRDWSVSKIAHVDFSSLKIIRDVALHMGVDANTKDAAFQPRKKMIVVGPQVQFALPSGYFNLAFDYSQEWNHNGIVGQNVSFAPAYEMEAVWGIPIPVYGTTWNFTGFFNYIGPKGRDGFGTETKAEILTRPELLLDVGELLGNKKGMFELGGGYEYWFNKFGNDHTKVSGSIANTPELIAKVHF